MKYKFFLVILASIVFGCSSPTKINSILETGSDSFQKILNDPKYEVQVIYSEIDENQIRHYYYNVDPNKFFYPASTVKMPIAFAAAKKLNELGLGLDTKLLIDSSEHNPRSILYDSLFQAPPTVENLIKKIFVFSDNQAYNQLYGWLGKDYINELNHSLGLKSSRIIHQLSESAFSFTSESNENTFNVRLVSDDTIGFKSEKNDFQSALDIKHQIKGKAYMNNEGEIVNEPFDFSEKNFFSLESLLGSLERMVKPSLFTTKEQYGLSQSEYQQMAAIMNLRPRDLPHPIDTLGDNYVKFFMFGDKKDKAIPEHIEIRNKVGWAYGYLTDVAYIRDKQQNIEFFLAATIHVNENQTYNDGKYEYEERGLPFLTELGQLFYDYKTRTN